MGFQCLQDEKVSSLFEKVWDADLVRDLFSVEEARCILGIPLSSRVETDFWYWLNEKTGVYSVKSAFTYLPMHREGIQDEIIGIAWKKFWSLKLPPKVKDFIWRAVKGCIPTGVQLRLRRVNVPVLCPVCHLDPESVAHCLLYCVLAQDWWEDCGMGGIRLCGKVQKVLQLKLLAPVFPCFNSGEKLRNGFFIRRSCRGK